MAGPAVWYGWYSCQIWMVQLSGISGTASGTPKGPAGTVSDKVGRALGTATRYHGFLVISAGNESFTAGTASGSICTATASGITCTSSSTA